MNFFDFNEGQQIQAYKKSLSFEIIFQLRFVDNLVIPEETPLEFQSLMRDQGYPNFNLGMSNIPNIFNPNVADMDNLNKMLSDYIFASADKKRPYQVSLAKDSLSLTHLGLYDNKQDEFKHRLIRILNSFFTSYGDTTITRIGLRHRNILNIAYISDVRNKGVEYFIPDYILPEIKKTSSGHVISASSKYTLSNDMFNVSLAHALNTVSGLYGQVHLNNERSYFIDIDCFIVQQGLSQLNQGVMENVSTHYDWLSRIYNNAFEWSITDQLRELLR